jgi:23S rRNA-/tRNA-specific pseudouridylate synthase/truncated hemoglobin YjbI
LALYVVHGFGGGGVQFSCTSHAQRRNQRQQQQYLSVAPPEIAIDTNTLLYQAYTALTVKEVKDILRQYGAKVTGNKSELIDRLGDILNGKDNYEEDEQHPRYVAKIKQKTLKEYNEMTLNELRELLRERGLNSEGNKRELVHRILISGYEAKSQLLDVVRNDNANNLELVADQPDDNREWQVLEPFIQRCQYLSNDEKTDNALGDGTELPFLSGLLFVNKPSGWSTLPTKQQLGNPTCPTYPCLSDSVIEWLKTDPKGKERLVQAQLDEQLWRDGVLQTEPRNSKQRRELKKRIRQYEKQLEKMPMFEPRPAHRLDIDTSGIVCVALTPTALRNANMLFEKKSRSGIEEELVESDVEEGCVEKQYVALVEGSMDKDSSAGVISHAIGKVWMDDHNEWACDVHGDGSFAFIRQNGSSDTTLFVPDTLREATTSYKAVDWGTVQTNGGSKKVTRVELTPHTGRGHQLRLHMASMNHPIVGDDMHGDKDTIDKQVQLCLHASKLSMDSFCFGSNDGDNASIQKCRVVIESAPPF